MLGRGELFAGISAQSGRAPLGKCFANAQALCLRRPELRYFEGLARPHEHEQWHPHAWAVDPDGAVIDPTWAAKIAADGHREPAYFGVELPLGELGAGAVAEITRYSPNGELLSCPAYKDPFLRHRWPVDLDAVRAELDPH